MISVAYQLLCQSQHNVMSHNVFEGAGCNRHSVVIDGELDRLTTKSFAENCKLKFSLLPGVLWLVSGCGKGY